MTNLDRRNFLKTTAGISFSIPVLSSFKLSAATKLENGNIPIILCSRGEDWGEKVLFPAWEVLQKTNSILDAVEMGANVVELDVLQF